MEKKKISEMNTVEKFNLFKEEMISSMVDSFRGPDIVQMPMMVFLGVKASALNKMMKANPEYIAEVGGEKWSGQEADPDKIHIVPIPIEKAMGFGGFLAKMIGEDAPDELKQGIEKTSKIAAAKMVRETIEEIRKHDINGVMYSMHVSESFVIEGKMTEKEKNHRSMTGEPLAIEKKINDWIEAGKSIRDLPEAKEMVTFCFEHKTATHMTLFDIDRDEENGYQYLTNREDTPHTGKGEGLFMNFVHEESLTNFN